MKHCYLNTILSGLDDIPIEYNEFCKFFKSFTDLDIDKLLLNLGHLYSLESLPEDEKNFLLEQGFKEYSVFVKAKFVEYLTYAWYHESSKDSYNVEAFKEIMLSIALLKIASNVVSIYEDSFTIDDVHQEIKEFATAPDYEFENNLFVDLETKDFLDSVVAYLK